VLSYLVAGNLKAEDLKCEDRMATASIPHDKEMHRQRLVTKYFLAK